MANPRKNFVYATIGANGRGKTAITNEIIQQWATNHIVIFDKNGVRRYNNSYGDITDYIDFDSINDDGLPK